MGIFLEGDTSWLKVFFENYGHIHVTYDVYFSFKQHAWNVQGLSNIKKNYIT
jgi:hypothetical protein